MPAETSAKAFIFLWQDTWLEAQPPGSVAVDITLGSPARPAAPRPRASDPGASAGSAAAAPGATALQGLVSLAFQRNGWFEPAPQSAPQDVRLELFRRSSLAPAASTASFEASRSTASFEASRSTASFEATLSTPALPAGLPNAGRSSLGVLSFNVLAPLWAAPKWYPADLDPRILDRTTRLNQTQDLLRSLSGQLDVICLQEVNAPELAGYITALGPDFTGQMAQNDRSWWSNWLVPEIPWEANGTAVIVRSSRFSQGSFVDVAMPDGNHAEVFQGIDTVTGQKVRVQSVHLDSDRISNHKPELNALFDRFPATPGVKDILAGDFNEDTDIGTAAGALKGAGYSDVLSALGNFEATHPWISSYNKNQRWGRIDHTTTRHAVAISGDVLDFGVAAIANETARITANFQNTGSDHFPVIASVI